MGASSHPLPDQTPLLPRPFREVLQELSIGFRDWKHGCVHEREAAGERPAARFPRRTLQAVFRAGWLPPNAKPLSPPFLPPLKSPLLLC